MIGRTVARYRILEKLGKGGMGEVYLAEDTRLHRRVALKILPPLMAADPERLERFAREATAVGSLNHPNIVTIHSIEEAEGLHLLVMERVEGGTLAERIPPGGLSEEDFFAFAIPLADALSAAHERGVTHRDLKPSNVMVTEDGRIKVVDFGLAKLRQELQARERTVVLDDELTEEGRILGTYPYMSPEQIKGKPVDHRSDVFSLGVVLYEMATGERPFSGETSADLISSILRDVPPPAHEVNRGLPRHLDRIITHCLEKDPDRRFQTAKDLRNELQSLHQERHSERLLRSTSVTRRIVRAARGRRWLWAGAAALAAAAVAAAALLLGPGWTGGREGAGRAESTLRAGSAGRAAEASRPALAVLFFQNLTGDPELEWLRTGLTEMLVTALSQSPGLRVISTDRLYQILEDQGGLDRAVISADLVREVAERSQAGTVLLGSYVQAGETLQVNATLQDAASGEILDAQRVQGIGAASVFSIVDRLSQGVLGSFERAGRLAGTERSDLERRIESVTTSSVEAFRLYAEGMSLRHELKIDEAIPFLERAVELDPGFAMAWARLAGFYETLGREEDQERALERAIAHADRLPARERFYVEGTYYGLRRETYGRAVRTLEEAVDLYPDHHSARHQLGLLYSYLELHDRAIAEFEELLRRGYDFDGVYNALAEIYELEDRERDARRLLAGWVEANPERWSGYLVLAWHATNWEAVDEAFEAVRKAEELRPGSPFVDFIAWRAALLDGRRREAEAAAAALTEGQGPYWRWRGFVGRAVLALYDGRAEEALAALDEAGRSYGGDEPLVGASLDRTAQLLLELDRPERALAAADRARAVAAGDWPAREGLFWSALAQQRLGRPGEADRLAAELAAAGRRLPGNVEERLHHRLLGLLAFARGEPAKALAELEQAVSLLPPRGLPWHRHRLPDHALLWFELAAVHRELGHTGEAERWLRRVTESGTERVFEPVAYVRSHYLLGRLLEERGDRDGAREAYRAFLGFWGDGDLDRERVADARERLAALD